MESLCKQFDCQECEKFDQCGGCLKRCNRGKCIAADTIKEKGTEGFLQLKEQLIREINDLNIDGLFLNDLNLLSGSYINLEYQLENGKKIKLLNDNDVYLGNQVERKNNERCYGVACSVNHILICEYGCNGDKPEIILYKKREL